MLKRLCHFLLQDLRQGWSNISRIDMWSMLHLSVFIGIGITQVPVTAIVIIVLLLLLQVLMIRQLFSEKSILNNLKRKLFA